MKKKVSERLMTNPQKLAQIARRIFGNALFFIKMLFKCFHYKTP